MQPDGPEIVIRRLGDVEEVVPVLVRWFEAEWEPYYGAGGEGDAEADLRAATNRHGLPMCLVALDGDGEPVGTATLRRESVASHRHLSPWLTALLVEPGSRRTGIGAALVATAEAEAREAGFDHLYTAASTSQGLFTGRGWQAIDEAPTLRGPAVVYALELRAAGGRR